MQAQPGCRGESLAERLPQQVTEAIPQRLLHFQAISLPYHGVTKLAAVNEFQKVNFSTFN